MHQRTASPDLERGYDVTGSEVHEGRMQTARRDELVIGRKARPIYRRKRDQEKQVCSVGDRPTEAKVRSLVARIAGRRETEFPKPIDEAIFQDGEQVIGP